MTDIPAGRGWVRGEDAPLLPPPPHTTGPVGWALRNLFPNAVNAILTVLGIAFAVWIAWGILKWALIDATFFGESRDACIAGQGEGAVLGACWPYIGAKFHQFIYGFYPFDQRWRVNICFIVGIAALVPMLIPSVPYKRWNALFLLVVYPLMTFILLTGGHLQISLDGLLGILELLLISSIVVSIAGFGIEEGVRRNAVGVVLAAISVLLWLASFFFHAPVWNAGGLSLSIFSIAILGAVIAAALSSLGAALLAADPSARSAFMGWLIVVSAILAAVILVSVDFGLVPVETQQWGGLLVTLVVAATGIVVSLPLGILLALGRRSNMPIVKLFSIIFIEVWRGVPLITVLFMASVMLPLFMPEGVTFDKLLRALVGTALFSAAYMAETVRGGLQAIPKGQYEAARALGLSYWMMMALIVLPQALKIVIPGIVNSFISLFKDTTLVAIIGLFDILGIVNAGFADPKWASPETAATGYFVAALIFWAFCFGMSRYSQFMERRLATGHRR
jgi:general L-amino acid transport system permease protein